MVLVNIPLSHLHTDDNKILYGILTTVTDLGDHLLIVSNTHSNTQTQICLNKHEHTQAHTKNLTNILKILGLTTCDHFTEVPGLSKQMLLIPPSSFSIPDVMFLAS